MAAGGGLAVHRGRTEFYEELRLGLIEFAEHQFGLARADKDGVTEREMLERLLERARTDQRREALEADLHGPPLPPGATYLWGWFNELSAARGSGGMGIAAITYPDIDAWRRLLGRCPTPWEVGVLKDLDRVFIRMQSRT